MPACTRWAWAAFGCYTKLHGTMGRVEVSTSNAVLAAEMGVPVEALISTIKSLPHVYVEETPKTHGKVTVMWRNWRKYQEDSTAAERQKSRSKRRGEENKNKKRSSKPLDAEFLAKLKSSPAYTGIDVDRELARMDNWLLANPDRQKTRRFIVGWLNKVDRPVAGVNPDPYAKFPKG